MENDWFLVGMDGDAFICYRCERERVFRGFD